MRIIMGGQPLPRSTLADANRRRPPQLFAETFAMLSGLVDRHLRRDGAAMLHLIDATPVPLHTLGALERVQPWAEDACHI